MIKEKTNFEESLKRLEKIVNDLENNNVSLDEAIELFKEGMIISKECSNKLKTIEEKAIKIVEDNQIKEEDNF